MGAPDVTPRRTALVRAAARLRRDWSQRWQGSFTAGATSFVFHLMLLLILACLLLNYSRTELPDVVTVTFEATLETELDDVIEELEGQLTLETRDRFASSAATAPVRPDVSAGISPGDLQFEIASSAADSDDGVVQPALVPIDPAGGEQSSGGEGVADDWNFPAGVGYEGRQPGNRTQLALLNGGSLASERAVEAGLDWLARHQRPDGSWSFQHLHADCSSDCNGPGTIDGSTAATGLALLCFLGAGHTHHDDSLYQETVTRGLEWLTAQSRVGDLRCSVDHAVPERHSGMYAQGIATMALCEAVGMTHDRLYWDEAAAAIQFIIESQDRYGGGWRYEPNEPGDTSVLGWQVMALVSARMSGINVPDMTREGTVHFLESVYIPGGRFGYTGPARSTWATTAIGQLTSMYLRSSLSPELLRPDVSQLATTDPRRNNAYDNYYIAQVLIQFGDAWRKWNQRLRDHLIDTQRTAGHPAGSWDPGGRWSSSGGRLYTTAMHVLTLEVYYRHLPLYSDQAFDILSPELAERRRPESLIQAPRRNGAPDELPPPVAAIEPTPPGDPGPESLAGLDCPTRYILNYPIAHRFCGPIRSTFEDAAREFATTMAGRRVGQHLNGGFGLPLLQVGTETLVHTGADYGWYQAGETVHAVANGIVRLSVDFQFLQPTEAGVPVSTRRQQLIDWGGTVIIEHCLPDGEYVTTLYAHLGLNRHVRTGDVVAAGQQIGTIAQKFESLREDYVQHLHFGVREGRLVETGSILFTLPHDGQPISVTLDEPGEQTAIVRFAGAAPAFDGVDSLGDRRVYFEPLDDGRYRIPAWRLWQTIPPEARLAGYAADLEGWLDPTLYLREHNATTMPAVRFAMTHDTVPNEIPNITGDPAPGWMIDDWLRAPAGGVDVAQLRGKTVVMLCVQNNCAASNRLALPTLADASARFAEADDVVLILHQTAFTDFHLNSSTTLRTLLGELPPNIAVGHSGNARFRPSVLDDYGVRGTPWTLIIGPDGIVEFSGCLVDSNELIRMVEELRGPAEMTADGDSL